MKTSLTRSAALLRIFPLLFLCFVHSAQPARAQWTVLDPANLAQAVESFRKLRTQLKTAKAQLDHMKYTARKLSNPNFRNIRGMQLQMEAMLRSGEGFAYSMEQMDQTFREAFPGERLPDEIEQTQSQALRRALGTAQGTLRSLQEQSRQLESSRVDVDRFKAQIRAIDTPQQASELQGTIQAFQAEQMMLLQQSIMAQTNQQAVMNAQRASERMQARALLHEQARRNQNLDRESASFGSNFADF